MRWLSYEGVRTYDVKEGMRKVMSTHPDDVVVELAAAFADLVAMVRSLCRSES